MKSNVTAAAELSAILTAIPDLMFIMQRDGTYVDYHARDAASLFAPPSSFIGRTVRDVMPPPLGDLMMNALEDASRSGDPVVLEYELPMGEPRYYEARNRELARRLISSQEVERQRIARELHDDISQRVAALNIELDRAATEAGSEALRAYLRRLSAQASEIAIDVQRVSYELHPSKLRFVGLLAALESLCGEVSKQRNLDVRFTHAAMPPVVDAAVSLCLYRIVQEALHNVARHSQARGAEVSVTGENSEVTLQIADSGIGFDPNHVRHDGLGLISMRERAADLNGRLTIDAAPGRGTQITVRIPAVS